MLLFEELSEEERLVLLRISLPYCLNNFSRSLPCSAPERSFGGAFLSLLFDGASPPGSG